MHYPVIVVHFQPLLRLAIDSRPRPHRVCLASDPHTRGPPLVVAGGGQPRPHRFHPPVPVLDPALTDVPVSRLPRFGLVTCGRPDAHRRGNLGNRGGKGLSWPCAVAPRHRHWLGPSVPSWVGWHSARRRLSYMLPERSAPSTLEATSSVGPGSGTPGASGRARRGTTPASPGAASWRRPGCHTLGEHSGGPGAPQYGEYGVRSLWALTPRLVHGAEPGKNKIWGSQTARFSLLQSEQPQLEYVCDYLLTSIIG
jgi:hypothetical protein